MTFISKPAPKLIKKFNTPEIVRGSWYTIWAVSGLLLISSIYAVNSQRQAIETVGKDTAPSVLTAQQLQDSFADLDASLANELLLKPGDNRRALVQFEINRKKIADRLVAAAKNIVYPGEEKIVQSLQLHNSAYLLKLQEARDAHKRGDRLGVLSIYQSAANLIDREIIPQAAQLSLLNSQELEKSYISQSGINNGISFIIITLGLLQVAVLVFLQIFLYLRMRRMLNLPLVGATAIAIVFLAYTISSFTSASSNLKVAKADAFDSLRALRQMRSLSYQANADESRYLLDRANADRHERSFDDNINQILTIPANRSRDSIVVNTTQGKSTPGIGGLFAKALNNITFAGEKELAIDTFKLFNDYLTIDKQIRQLARNGKIAEAIALGIGNNPGESNWAFDRYKNKHTELMELNKQEFEKNIEIGTARLANFEVIATVSLGSIAILTLFGVRPRLMEYL
ncbi:hypothetical protein [Chamaesiphon sp.]|uniref:hypothetical protein n=1 Tax=Chamaesiphon sp. TaxID=2814140 RepID=UPI0035939449